jgi:hypothetical protein
MPDSISIEVPTIAIEAKEIAPERVMISLVVLGTGFRSEYFLCTQDQNYQAIAKQIHDKICEAGQQGRRAVAQQGNGKDSGLIVVRDLPDSMKGGSHGGTFRG